VIEHPVMIGQTATALTLLYGSNIQIGTDNQQRLYVYDSSLHHTKYFNSEDDLMIWLLEQIHTISGIKLVWFKDHGVQVKNTA